MADVCQALRTLARKLDVLQVAFEHAPPAFREKYAAHVDDALEALETIEEAHDCGKESADG